MNIGIAVLTGLVCLIHFYIMFLEMVLWEKKRIRTIFGLSAEFAKQTRMMAFNQGLYNGFLAAGLLWTFIIVEAQMASHIRLFFLGCIVVAGVVGALTASKRILWIQTVPALIPLILILINGTTL